MVLNNSRNAWTGRILARHLPCDVFSEGSDTASRYRRVGRSGKEPIVRERVGRAVRLVDGGHRVEVES